MSIEATLARFAHEARPSAKACDILRLCLRDWAACGIAGAGEPVARILRAHLEGSTGPATLIGGGTALAGHAALCNGTTSHALDYDDTHFAHIGHPSVAVIPAALALAEQTGASLDALVEAAAIGAEASIRVGIWLGRAHYETGFHQTATAGAFGATLAAARLLSLEPQATRMALGLAATRASGLKSQFGTMGKPYNAGLAAETGVEAALLARAGMTSAARGLSDGQGFGPTHHGAADATAFDGLGDDWALIGISHKFHACCHGLHAMLEALAGMDALEEEITSVSVQTHPRWRRVCDIAEPRTGLEAKFSYRLTAAMALSGIDTAAISSFTDEAARDPALCALRDRVSVVSDDTLTEMQARVTIATGAGDRIELCHDLDATLPYPARAERIDRKTRALIGEARADALRLAVEGEALEPLTRLLAQDVSS